MLPRPLPCCLACFRPAALTPNAASRAALQIYPILAAEYVAEAMQLKKDDDEFQAVVWGAAEICVVLVTIMKLMGPDMVIKFAELCSMISLVPAFIFLVWGFIAVPVKPERWFQFNFDEQSGFNNTASPSLLSTSDGTSFTGGTFASEDPYYHSAVGLPADLPKTNWALLVSWQLWLQAGYVGLGSLAETMHD